MLSSFTLIRSPTRLPFRSFRARFGLNTNTPIFGPSAAGSANEGDTVELYKPDALLRRRILALCLTFWWIRVSYLPDRSLGTAAAGVARPCKRRVNVQLR